MKIGEIREIFIHPSVAYGIYTSLEKGIYLKARVQLIEINGNDVQSTFPALTTTDLNEDFGESLKYNFFAVSKVEGYNQGQTIWEHYKKEPSYSLSQILEGIHQLNKKTINVDLDSTQNQALITKIHWNVYNIK
jgi:hypothetical protein